MKKYLVSEILENAKRSSPYYSEIFSNITVDSLKNIPITNQEKFWKSEMLTSKVPNGIVFKSGGSSGVPKFSYFTNEEWITFTKYFGWGMSQGILTNGDKVANLFYAGDLYASFLFIKDSLQWIDPEFKAISQYPIAGNSSFENMLKTFEEFQINVLCGVPSQILKLLEYFDANRTIYKNINITKILFGGESLYPDQEIALQKIIPNLKISSVGYASVDGGLLGYSSLDCLNGEHRVFDGATIIELVDIETNEIIDDINIPGKVILTNLTRNLMPIIRYPAGDVAMWVEESGTKNRKFKLCGRSDEGARLGTITVVFEDTRDMIIKCLKDYSGIQFQMILDHYDHKDSLVLKIAGHQLNSSSQLIEIILSSFKSEIKVYEEVLKKNLIHPLKIEIVKMEELESNLRTGKIKRVIDKRFKQS